MGCRQTIHCYSIFVRRTTFIHVSKSYRFDFLREQKVMIVLIIYFQWKHFYKIDSHARNFGVVHDLPASAWDSYMPVADHPEYPSLSASVCAAHAEVSRAFLGNDKTELEPFLFIKVYWKISNFFLSSYIDSSIELKQNDFSQQFLKWTGKFPSWVWPNTIQKYFSWIWNLDWFWTHLWTIQIVWWTSLPWCHWRSKIRFLWFLIPFLY